MRRSQLPQRAVRAICQLSQILQLVAQPGPGSQVCVPNVGVGHNVLIHLRPLYPGRISFQLRGPLTNFSFKSNSGRSVMKRGNLRSSQSSLGATGFNLNLISHVPAASSQVSGFIAPSQVATYSSRVRLSLRSHARGSIDTYTLRWRSIKVI